MALEASSPLPHLSLMEFPVPSTFNGDNQTVGVSGIILTSDAPPGNQLGIGPASRSESRTVFGDALV